MDLGDMVATLQESGKYSKKDLDDFAKTYAKGKYEPETVEEFAPVIYIDSDKTIPFGKEDLPVRYMNADDTLRLVGKVKTWSKYLFGKDHEKVKQMQPMEFLGHVVERVVGEAFDRKHTKFFRDVCEELSILLSNPDEDREISPEMIISIPLEQFEMLIPGIVEVNRIPFLRVWERVPGNARSILYSMIGRLISIATMWTERMGTMATKEISSGGQDSGGKSSSSTPSKKKKAGAKKKREAPV